MFPDNNESTFEKHEGTAQYTGLRIAYTKDRTIRHMAIRRLRYEAKKGYVNSFAYATGPAYALLLDRINPAWRSGIATAEGLSEAAADALSETKTNKDSSSPTAKKRMEATRSDSYARYLKAERKTAGDSSRYTGWLASDANVLRIPNDGIHISFNPNDRVIPLADPGRGLAQCHPARTMGYARGKTGTRPYERLVGFSRSGPATHERQPDHGGGLHPHAPPRLGGPAYGIRLAHSSRKRNRKPENVNIELIVIGKTDSKEVAALVEQYARRVNFYCKFAVTTLPTCATPRA